ncbi:MAG: Crp/Fnr family transcriptional regulator, partial [Burkholderiales bacterium]
MHAPHSSTQNQLLAALPEPESARVAPGLELVSMPLGEVLGEPGRAMQYVYFPTTCIVSLLHILK